MTNHGIPESALDKHIAILGKTGSGKSSLAKLLAEDLLVRKSRVNVIDGHSRSSRFVKSW